MANQIRPQKRFKIVPSQSGKDEPPTLEVSAQDLSKPKSKKEERGLDNVREMGFETVKSLTEKYILDTYNRYPIAFRYGVGDKLYDLENREYIDFNSGIAVTNLGHGEADIIEAVRTQADKLFHTSNLFYSEEQAKLAEVIIENSFPGKVFFCNSGTEANEAAFKLMRRHGINKKIRKPVILALEGSFHGRTVSSLTLTGQDSMREGFGELVTGIDYVTPNNEESLVEMFEKYAGSVCGLIVEPILGEGGVKPLTQKFVNLARKITEETDSIFVFDEIQTGIGRTGKLFCFEHFGIAPDAVTLAKALASGFPMGAMIVSKEFEKVLGKGMHGSTFGGNHLACAVAYETFRVILTREILKNVEEVSEYFFGRLNSLKQKCKLITDVRGIGLHIGVELNVPSRPIVETLLTKGLVANATAKNTIRIIPPIIISMETAEEGLDILEKVLMEHHG